MPSNATAEHVAVVLSAFAEEFLVNVPATFDGVGTYQIEFNTLCNYLVNSPRSVFAEIAEYINQREASDGTA